MTNETNKRMVEKTLFKMLTERTHINDNNETVFDDYDNDQKCISKFVFDFSKELRHLIEGEGKEELIKEIEFLRQGFRSAIDGSRDKVFRFSMDAYHKNADRLVVELGGESVRPTEDEKKEEAKIELLKCVEGSVTND